MIVDTDIELRQAELRNIQMIIAITKEEVEEVESQMADVLETIYGVASRIRELENNIESAREHEKHRVKFEIN